MKRLPKTVSILGFNIKVVKISPDKLLELFNEDNPQPYDVSPMGCANIQTRTIYIANDLSAEIQMETLYHEIGHMLLHLSGLEQCIDPAIHEALVQLYAITFMGVQK